MYSYEDRIRAVKLYLKLGKRLAAAVRQLGYPTTKSLERWYHMYERCLDLPRERICLRPRYSAEQKKAAADHYMSHGQCLAATTKALGYPGRGTLVVWLDELHPERKKRVLGKASGIRHTPELRKTAVIDLCTRRESAEEVAKKIGVSRPTLYNWRTRLLGQEATSNMTRRNDPPQSSEKVTLEQQVESLRRDIRKLQIEHDILKKANENKNYHNSTLQRRPASSNALCLRSAREEAPLFPTTLMQPPTAPAISSEVHLDFDEAVAPAFHIKEILQPGFQLGEGVLAYSNLDKLRPGLSGFLYEDLRRSYLFLGTRGTQQSVSKINTAGYPSYADRRKSQSLSVDITWAISNRFRSFYSGFGGQIN